MKDAYLLSQDQGVVHKLQQALLESLLISGEGSLGCVIVEVGGAHVIMLRVLNNGGLEVVEREEVGNHVGFRVLHDIRPDHLILLFRLVQQPVFNLLAVKRLIQLKALLVPLEQVLDSVNVLGFHRAQVRGGRDIGKVVLANLASLGGSVRERREANLVELQPVEGTVVVAARADRGGQKGASRVDGLVNSVQIAPARDLLDQDWCQTLRSELLVDAKEVDLCHLELLVAHSDLRWHTANGSNQLLRLGGADTNVPLLFPAWRHQSPVSVSMRLANKTSQIALTNVETTASI